PLGGLDGIMLIKVIGQRFGKVKFIVNDLLLYLQSFEDVFVPINKHGLQNQDYATRINDTYHSDAQVIYFPAGLCSRKIKGRITDPPWKRNVFQKAIKHQRDIVPVFFSGQNTPFFYRLANLRKRLHIPFNVEMLYLSDEAFKQEGRSFDVYFGKPVPYRSFSSGKSPDQWVQEIRDQVYALPQQYKPANL
ncbi:MAG: glycerol acyltransferase, partial [Bacteroidales bacterium]|nr:glycerol acyltransferase [Bacteroidales bacterium]